MASRIAFLLQLLLAFAAIGLLCVQSQANCTETSKQVKIPASLNDKGEFLRLILAFHQKTKVVKLSRFGGTKFSSMQSLSSLANFVELILDRFPEDLAIVDLGNPPGKAMLLRVWYQDTLFSTIAVDDDVDLESCLEVAEYQPYSYQFGHNDPQYYKDLRFRIVVTPGRTRDTPPESLAFLTAHEVRNSLETSKRAGVPAILIDRAGARGFILLRLKFRGEIEVVKIGVNKEADTKLSYMESLSTLENFRHLIAERFLKVPEPGFGRSKTNGAGGNVLSVTYLDRRQLVTVEDDMDLEESLEFAGSSGYSHPAPYYQYLEFEIDLIRRDGSYIVQLLQDSRS